MITDSGTQAASGSGGSESKCHSELRVLKTSNTSLCHWQCPDRRRRASGMRVATIMHESEYRDDDRRWGAV